MAQLGHALFSLARPVLGADRPDGGTLTTRRPLTVAEVACAPRQSEAI
jgi:hypothetical protein